MIWRFILINAWQAAVETWRDCKEEKAHDKRRARCMKLGGHHWVKDNSYMPHAHSDGRMLYAHYCSCGEIGWKELNEPQ